MAKNLDGETAAITSKKCYLHSTLDYAAIVPYGKENMVIPARAQKRLINEASKLGKLPKGIIKIDI